MTIHAGVMREHVPFVRKRITACEPRRFADAHWMEHQETEFLHEHFDDICKVSRSTT